MVVNKSTSKKIDKPTPECWAGLDLLADAALVLDLSTGTIPYMNGVASGIAEKLSRDGLSPDDIQLWLDPTADPAILDDLVNNGAKSDYARGQISLAGRVYDASLQSIPQANSDRMVLTVLRDITEQRDAERVRQEFTSTISHELRSPLTAIKGAMGLILSGAAGELTDKSQKLVSMAYRNADRLVLIVNDMLDLDKIADGAMILDNRDVDLETVATDAIEAVSGFQGLFSVDIIVDVAEPGLVSTVDPNRMVQVIVNLLSNAIKFSSAGSTVTLRISRQGAANRISVIDTGEGIPDDAQPTLFDRFVQIGAKHRAATGGTGLGLSIVKAIVDLQGGEIHFESSVGVGTTFHVDLPCAENELSVVNTKVKRVS